MEMVNENKTLGSRCRCSETQGSRNAKTRFSPGVGKDAANQLTCSRSLSGCDVAFLGLAKSELPQLEAVTYKMHCVNVCF